MSSPKFQSKLSTFKQRITESSPLEAPLKGFNRIDREMSPATRELVLQARLPEIMAFADDRRLNPAVVAGIVEASMRLGRIPDVGMYGLAGDDALAVRDFVYTSMLGLEAELAIGLPQITESHDKHQKHAGFAGHYKNLANHHQRAIEFHTQAASKANKSGAPFTAARHQAKVGLLKQLHAAHSALADYHDCEARRFQPQAPVAQQSAGQQPAHPAQGSTAAQSPLVAKQEQTVSANLSPFMKMPTAFLQRPPLRALHSKWKKEQPEEEEEEKVVRSESREGLFKRIPLLDDMLAEAEKAKADKAKKKSKKDDSAVEKALGHKSDPNKVHETLANVKCAPLFQQLGHKMDHAEAKLKSKKKVGSEWADKLYKTCLAKGASAASDEVVKASLAEPWIRDQGFVDESSNLRAHWATMMSAETQTNAIRTSSTSPQPMVFTINRMLDMAQGKGSIY